MKIWGWGREGGETTADDCHGAGDEAWGLGRVPEAQPRSFPLLSKVEKECGQWTSVTCVEGCEQYLLHSLGSLCLATQHSH